MSAAPWSQRLRDNIARVHDEIARACARAARDPGQVRLIAVTKYVSPEILRAVVAAGVNDIGESRVQQLTQRARALGDHRLDWPTPHTAHDERPRWHMIGHLQRNKVKALLPYARIVHSLDSVRLAETLEHHATELGAAVDVFIEVNVAGEAAKTGAPPADLPGLVECVAGCPHLCLRGLMTMAPYAPGPETARPHFARLRELLAQLRAAGRVGPACVELSMGMSSDFAVAVEEGATFVRVGSALFEGLPTGDPRGS